MATDNGPAPDGGRGPSEVTPPRDGSTGSAGMSGPAGAVGAATVGAASPAARPSRWQLTKADFYSGAIFVAFGIAFAAASSQYTVGTLLRMGPGYFPRLLGISLARMGLAIIAVAVLHWLRPSSDDTLPEDQPVPWLRGALLLVAVLLFGFIIGGAGLLPTVLLTTFIAALAGQGTTPARAAVIAVGITILCMVIFVFLLRLTVPLFGPWVGG